MQDRLKDLQEAMSSSQDKSDLTSEYINQIYSNS